MSREFAIVPPDARMIWLSIGLPLILALTGLAIGATQEPRVLYAAPLIIPVFAVLYWSLRRQRVAIEGDRLTIAAGINSARIKLADLDPAAARVIDLGSDPGLRPGLKTFGTAMPGYLGGHFRLRNRSKAFVLVTDRRRVLALPERNGRILLLSVQNPKALLDALQTGTRRT